MNNILATSFIKEEIKQALFQMFPTKAPGPNGFLTLFYHNYVLEYFKTSIVEFCLQVLNDC